MPTVQEKIVTKIKQAGRGWCFTALHFSELGTNESIRKALSHLAKIGQIKRLSFGLYEYPRKHKALGVLPPDLNRVIQAVTEKDKVKFQPFGAYAANLLGISEQVPANIVVLTSGATKTICVGKTEIQFKRTTPKNMLAAGTITGLIIQAFRFIGRDNITASMIKKLRKNFSSDDLNQLRRALDLPPVWISTFMKKRYFRRMTTWMNLQITAPKTNCLTSKISIIIVTIQAYFLKKTLDKIFR